MKYLYSTLLSLALVAGTASAVSAQEEIAVIAPGGAAAAVKALIPGFESKTGYKVKFTSGSGQGTKQQIVQGDPFDVALVQLPLADVVASGNVVTASQKPVVATVIGVAVKKGAPKPDISTPDAVKKLLLSVKSLSYPDAAAGAGAGISITATLKQMGIQDQVQAKTKLEKSGSGAVQDVAKGDVDIGMTYLSEIDDPGVDVVGRLPAAISPPTQLFGFVTTHAKNAKAAQAFLDYVTSPMADKVYVSLGMQPLK